MDFKKLLLHPNFSYIYLFTVVVCAVSFFVMEEGHPVKYYIFPLVVVLFILQRYRQYLMKQNQEK